MSAQTYNMTVVATSPKQLELRRRIIQSAISSAKCGGGSLQIRSVAQGAGVAPGTVYRYFSSKDDLLVACIHHWLLEAAGRCEVDPQDTDPIRRVLDVVDRITRALCAEPSLANAAASAYLYPDSKATDNAELFRADLGRILSAAMNKAGSRPDEFIGNLLVDVWVLNIPAIIQQRQTIDRLRQRMRTILGSMASGASSVLAS